MSNLSDPGAVATAGSPEIEQRREGSPRLARRMSFRMLFGGSLTDLLRPPVGQIGYLDGLRTIAIVLVMCQHLSAKFVPVFGANRFASIPFVANGWIGVDLFFILSGFLIGGQLWKEVLRTRTVAIGTFILRRGYRIWPLYFFMFLCVSACRLSLVDGHITGIFGWTDLVFLTNYISHGIVMGSWSLCTEEQFYIAVPILLFLFASRASGLSRFRPWLWVLLCCFPLIRAVYWVTHAGHFFAHDPRVFQQIYYPSITHCDGLIMGMIVSNAWVSRRDAPGKAASPWLLLALAFAAAAGMHVLQKEVFDFSALALVFGALAWLGLTRRIPIFNARPFYWISRLSFGMYLNHEYLCPWIVASVLPHMALVGRAPAAANVLGVGLLIVLSAALSVVTFCLVEHPFLQMRKVALGH